MIGSTSTLRSIALEHPATIRVFEQFHLDYCCGGNRPLDEACAAKGIASETLLAALNAAVSEKAGEQDFSQATPTALIRHIVGTHHAYVRSELERLLPMAERVAAKHGALHPEVVVLESQLRQLADDLIFHLNKEERILFPYIEGLEKSLNEKTGAPSSCFGTVESPIQAMLHEHESAGSLMEQMRAETENYTAPEGACPTYLGLYHGLDAFEKDLHRHVHLENNLLFPRSIELEKAIMVAQ